MVWGEFLCWYEWGGRPADWEAAERGMPNEDGHWQHMPSQGEFKCSGLVPQVGVRGFEGLRRWIEAKDCLTGRARREGEEKANRESNEGSI